MTVTSHVTKRGKLVYRDSKGRFISESEFMRLKRIEVRPSQRIVTFRERIRGTRIAQIVRKSYPRETNTEQIQQDLESRYDRGYNYVIGIISIQPGTMERDEVVVETLGPESGDSS